MLRLPRFDAVAPSTIDEAIAALAQPGARLIAGGTDLLPNLKHRLDRPNLLVSLGGIKALTHVTKTDEVVRIGAATTLTELSEHTTVQELFPSLATAAGLVASPSIRNMATIGGNVHLDTRCRYVNQTEFWRSAIGGCLKSEGDVCHVVPKGRNCVAAFSSDCVPVLISLDASVVLRSVRGERVVALADYYNTDGVKHVNKQADELMTEVRITPPTTPRRSTYAKWTVRSSIDYPLVSVALRFDLDADSNDATITGARICIGVLNAKPRLIVDDKTIVGRMLSAQDTVAAVGDLVYKRSKPLENVPYEAGYRRKMLPVYTRRAMQALLDE